MDWQRILINDFSFQFLCEIMIRTIIMFLIILFVLRISGKRGVRQLSIFEMAVIIGLGSAAGDPMFNEDIAILPAFIVCITAILLYRMITWLAARRESFEKIIEGKPIYIVEEGKMVIKDDSHRVFAKDEFFAELRQTGVEHLGQVKIALLETSGQMSVYFYGDKEVRPGLPIIPKQYQQHSAVIKEEGLYACAYCGNVKALAPGTCTCERCKHTEWVSAISTLRVT